MRISCGAMGVSDLSNCLMFHSGEVVDRGSVGGRPMTTLPDLTFIIELFPRFGVDDLS